MSILHFNVENTEHSILFNYTAQFIAVPVK